jgi:hypothetical protein
MKNKTTITILGILALYFIIAEFIFNYQLFNLNKINFVGYVLIDLTILLLRFKYIKTLFKHT